MFALVIAVDALDAAPVALDAAATSELCAAAADPAEAVALDAAADAEATAAMIDAMLVAHDRIAEASGSPMTVRISSARTTSASSSACVFCVSCATCSSRVRDIP